MADAFASGGCLCGEVTFTAAAPPIVMSQCHCTDCQRVSGGGHLSVARFKRDDIAIKGQPKTHAIRADSGNVITRHFCPTCGSRLFSETTGRPGIIGVMAGAFDDNSWFQPEMIIFKRSQPLWDITTCDVPGYQTLPPPI
ncbi:GFA family protein [Hyphomicrobium sp. D-2]|uniref:GFA family protein n=1 Tax=Hyphomicrobium sp. D-2 TaxID=3041621 RepID=UPI002458F66D|nr:GFA family protein [Hyphomicrobium sp. D-2]MDH4982649.1 GFA family protein [Hyphomicrobium sp. D-2]